MIDVSAGRRLCEDQEDQTDGLPACPLSVAPLGACSVAVPWAAIEKSGVSRESMAFRARKGRLPHRLVVPPCPECRSSVHLKRILTVIGGPSSLSQGRVYGRGPWRRCVLAESAPSPRT